MFRVWYLSGYLGGIGVRWTPWVSAALALLVGLLGPGLTPDGTAGLKDEQRRAAVEALQFAHLVLENPLERLLLARALRVEEVRPLPEGTMDHLGTGPCLYEVRVRAYAVFWIPYATVTVRCGQAGVTRGLTSGAP